MHHWPVMYSCMVKEPSWYRKKETETEKETERKGKGGSKYIVRATQTCGSVLLQKNVKSCYLGLTCKIRNFIAKTKQRLPGFAVLLFRCNDFRRHCRAVIAFLGRKYDEQ